MLIKVIAKTGIRSNEEIQSVNGEFIVRTKAKPIDREANKRIREMLSKYFKVPKSCVTLKRGDTSHIKYFEIEE